MFVLRSPADRSTVCLQAEAQREFLLDEKRRAETDGALTYKWDDPEKQGTDHTAPEPIPFAWAEIQEKKEENEGPFYLLISETADIKDPWTYVTDKDSHLVYNLKTDTEYFWCVQRNGKRSEVFSFHTSPALPRCIHIGNLSNVRDMGGYPVAGGRIRQGLVYRGSEFELHMHLNHDGIEEIRRLGIRTELDLRGDSVGRVDFTSAQAIGIKRVFAPIIPYTKVFEKEYSRDIKRFFKTFTVQKNYPIYFHCLAGADRTGTLAFILGAFLGMRLEDLINEYEFSSLSIFGIRTRNYGEFREFLQMFMKLPGNTLREKGCSFLREYAGLSEQQLSRIRDMLIEKNV